MDIPSSIHIENDLLFEQVLSYLQQGKGVFIPIKGKSMRPFLREGDKVLLESVDHKALSRGMIVLAKMDGKWLLHRVVRLGQSHVSLTGDANVAIHEAVAYSDIKAIAIALKREGKEYNLNDKWRLFVGLVWYRMRPIRRVTTKIFNK